MPSQDVSAFLGWVGFVGLGLFVLGLLCWVCRFVGLLSVCVFVVLVGSIQCVRVFCFLVVGCVCSRSSCRVYSTSRVVLFVCVNCEVAEGACYLYVIFAVLFCCYTNSPNLRHTP